MPANRLGSYEFNGAQLKTIQEVITLSVFSVFSVLYLGEKFKWNYAVGFAFIVLGAFFVFHKWLEGASAIQATSSGRQTNTSCLLEKWNSAFRAGSTIPDASAIVFPVNSASAT